MAATEFLCTVRSFKMLTPTVFELAFDTDRPFEFKAGQFVSAVIPGAGPKGRDLRRAYSISSAPEARPVELCIKVVDDGPGSHYLYQMRPGDHFKAFAPYGDFVYEHTGDRHVFFIATGAGVAPFRSMILSREFQASPPRSTTCLLGVRTEDEILYPEMKELPGLNWVATVSQPNGSWSGPRGRVTDHLLSLGPDYPWLEAEYFLCGNGGMINDVKALLFEKGVSKECIHQEIYYK